MSGGFYTFGKRQREAEQADKRRAKEEKRRRKRDEGPREPQITTREEINRNVPSVDAAMRMIEQRANSSSKGTSGPPCRLYVGGLSFDTTGETLRATLAQFGTVTDAVVVYDRNTGDSRGFGFVTMESRKDAAKAIAALNDTELDGRNIVVKAASERER